MLNRLNSLLMVNNSIYNLMPMYKSFIFGPSCSKCKFYEKITYNCKLFNENAAICRLKTNKCGVNGMHFIQKN
jgi:hypothetical protein